MATTAKATKAKAKVEDSGKLIALTVKVDGDTYVRLGTLRAKERMTVQDVLASALKAYLDSAGA